MLIAEKNRFQTPNNNLIKDSCKAHIDYLATQISYITEEIRSKKRDRDLEL